jgi:hypothetical protein
VGSSTLGARCTRGRCQSNWTVNINESVLYRKETHYVPKQKLDTIESYFASVYIEGLGQRHEFAFCQKPRRLKYYRACIRAPF